MKCFMFPQDTLGEPQKSLITGFERGTTAPNQEIDGLLFGKLWGALDEAGEVQDAGGKQIDSPSVFIEVERQIEGKHVRSPVRYSGRRARRFDLCINYPCAGMIDGEEWFGLSGGQPGWQRGANSRAISLTRGQAAEIPEMSLDVLYETAKRHDLEAG